MTLGKSLLDFSFNLALGIIHKPHWIALRGCMDNICNMLRTWYMAAAIMSLHPAPSCSIPNGHRRAALSIYSFTPGIKTALRVPQFSLQRGNSSSSKAAFFPLASLSFLGSLAELSHTHNSLFPPLALQTRHPAFLEVRCGLQLPW